MEKLSLRYKDEYIDLSDVTAGLVHDGAIKNQEFINHIVDNTVEIDHLEQEKREKVLFELISLEFSLLTEVHGPEYLKKDLSPKEFEEKERYNLMVMRFESIQRKIKIGIEIRNKEQVLENLLKEMNNIYHLKKSEELKIRYSK
jgi:hypothetical protein